MAKAKMRQFGSLALAASAVALPMAGSAQAADFPVKAQPIAPVWVPHWYFSAEGGLLISDFSRSAFPNGLSPAFNEKLGDFTGEVCDGGPFECSTDVSGSLGRRRNIGWYGALSIGRDIDPFWDWRLSGSFNSFFRNRRSAAINQEIFAGGRTLQIDDGPVFDLNTSRLVTESDRFRFATVDFDVGRKWEAGLLHLRTFGGLRAMLTDDRFNVSNSEAKGLFVGELGIDDAICVGPCPFFTSQTTRFTEAEGRSHFAGLGPKIGVEGFYGTTVGIAGAAQAAVLPGWRYSTFDQTSTALSSFTIDKVGPITFNRASAASISRSRFTVVGDLTANLGLAWRPAPTVSFEAGYRAEALLNVRDSFAFANTSASAAPIFGPTSSGQFHNRENVLIHGPYVKAVVVY